MALLLGCSTLTPGTPRGGPPASPAIEQARFDALVPRLLRDYHSAGVGIGIIRGGELVWTGYYGEQAPGVPVSASTVFNTASVAKTVTAETIISLASKGLINLDEPIAAYVKHPDLKDDPRYGLLTPRLLLSHRSGLLNWSYEYKDGRLAFVRDPDTRFGYSGAGVELAAQYAEAKGGHDFEALASEHLLGSLGVTEMSMGRLRTWLDGRLAVPMNAKGEYRPLGELNGRFAENSGGRWSAADDLLTTVDAYATFLTGVIRSNWLTTAQVAERSAILTSLSGDPTWNCDSGPEVRCADAYGHGIGWMVYRYGDHTVLKHGGNDAGENALVYFSPDTKNGAVIFVNGGNGIFVTVRVLELIGDEPHVAGYYRQLVKKHYGVSMPPLADID
ncbi:MAG: beta-lactamase family protein [Gemmatimonadaceae bacterium]|nr:beta-lactamase family protein [Gemmatimonadaceae bacterium]